MRGENAFRINGQRFHMGTSPRARGKRIPGIFLVFVPGNIPACAGKTTTEAVRSSTVKEHPRVRGENPLVILPYDLGVGTSPRARGKLLDFGTARMDRRNIPACAGKTAQNKGKATLIWEHPRVRGENPKPHRNVTLVGGTSPRARGKQKPYIKYAAPERNIPACAGKTVAPPFWRTG